MLIRICIKGIMMNMGRLFEARPMRLGELQVDDKRKRQLVYSIGQMLKESSMPYPTPYPFSNEQEIFINTWKLRHDCKYDIISKMKDSEEEDKEEKKFWWSIEEEDCFTRVFGDEVWDYLDSAVMDSYPDQVAIKKEECSGDELQEESSSYEEEDELPEEDIDNNGNETSNSYLSALAMMDWGLRSHLDYQEDYWIGDSGASGHMVGEDKDLFCKDSHSRKGQCS